MGIRINGVTFDGDNVSIINGVVFIDGIKQDYKIDGISKSSPVTVHGNVNQIECVNCTINGDVLGDIEATNVTCGNVGGDIDAINVTKSR